MSELEQQPQHPATAVGIGRIVAVFVLVFGATALAVRCVAVASQSPHGDAGSNAGDSSAHGPKVAGPAYTIEQLAAKTGCQPKIQTKAAELRQGVCVTQNGRYFVTTFTTAQAQRTWLEEAQDYGGLLVGNRWVVGSTPQVLKQLHGKLGGDLYDMSHHGKPAGSA
jgi:hypothetical protein